MRWVPRAVLDAAHLDQLREHGDMPGIRDENTLKADLVRPQQKLHYEPDSDIALHQAWLSSATPPTPT